MLDVGQQGEGILTSAMDLDEIGAVAAVVSPAIGRGAVKDRSMAVAPPHWTQAQAAAPGEAIKARPAARIV